VQAVSVLGRLRRAQAPDDPRSLRFSAEDDGRFWWHKLPGTDYVPPIYASLSDDEWAVMAAWYEETARIDAVGEINVPAMSLVQGLVMGNAIGPIVQLGHYFGYSALLIGFMLRRMDARPGLVSIDIDDQATRFTQRWIDRAGLGHFVRLHTGDSAAESSLKVATTALGGMPQLILLDSSHQYEHTLRELELWVPRMEPFSLLLLHDTSTYATSFDTAGAGGVQKALDDWMPGRPDVAYISLNRQVAPEDHAAQLTYKDGCGLGIVQKLR
jgi:predicted O-methyltransferase YrrM